VTAPPQTEERRAGELNARELLRWGWRQLTSMRTALVLLLLLALAAVPGSVIPQESVDSLGATRWKDQHPDLTPIYEKLDLFSVFDSVWFSAIYILLMISLVGCFVPRTLIYWRGLRAQPPPVPRHLTRLPDHATYATDDGPDEHLERAREVLRRRGYRLRASDGGESVSAERGYLREAGNLVFHVSVLVVLVGFALGGLFGYQGGVILVEGSTFSNNLTQYDDFAPGSMFRAEEMEPFSFDVESFDVDWLETDPGSWMAQSFNAGLRYRESPDADDQTYDLRVNHPLSIGDTDVFLIGHGYAPVVTVRDGNGEVAYRGPSVFLPQDGSFLSFGVIKAPDAEPAQLGFEGLFYPTFVNIEGDPVTMMPDDKNPTLSMLVYTGDLGLDSGLAQSVYVLDKSNADQVKDADGKPFRVDIQPGQTVELPDGLGSIEFEGVKPWTRIQISQTPGKEVALAGVVLALVGLLGSLFIRPRRVWVRARRHEEGTMVEAAALDRSGNGEMADMLDEIVAELRRTEKA
jgi:cytochrome c biogenesis protein